LNSYLDHNNFSNAEQMHKILAARKNSNESNEIEQNIKTQWNWCNMRLTTNLLASQQLNVSKWKDTKGLYSEFFTRDNSTNSSCAFQ